MSDSKKPGPSQATKLVELALVRYRLGVSTEGKPFGFTPDTPHIALPLKGNQLGLRAKLACDYFNKYAAAPSQSALTDCLAVLEGTCPRADTPASAYARRGRF